MTGRGLLRIALWSAAALGLTLIVSCGGLVYYLGFVRRCGPFMCS